MRILQISITIAALILISANIFAQNCEYDSTNVVQYSNEVEQDTNNIDTTTLQGRPQPNLPTDRLVFWVHGLGGTESSWSRAATVSMSGHPGVDFDEREIVSEYKNIAYPKTENYLDMDGLAIDLAKIMDDQAENHDNGNYNWEDGIVFGHSQGGVLARLMDERFVEGHETAALKAYGGIVTFATSNQGAQIINNRDIMQDALESFANDMAAGPFEAIITPKSSFFRLLIDAFNVDDLTKELKNIATKNIGKYLINENLPSITDEYAVPDANNANLGTATTRINDYTTNSTDLVAFYGDKPKVYHKNVSYQDEEDDQWGIINFPHAISWVTIHYFLKASTEYDHFKAHEYESETPINVFLTRRNYVSAKLEEEDLIDRLNDKLDEEWCPEGILGGPCIWRTIILEQDLDASEKRKEAWQKGISALDNFNEQYLIVIGARVKEEVEADNNDVCVCEDRSGNVTYYEENSNAIDCGLQEINNPGWTCEFKGTPYPTFNWVEKPSDGVVLTESASDIPQQTHPPQEMTGNKIFKNGEFIDIGTTHMELRNDITTKQALNKIFDGDVGDFFFTDKR